MKRPTIQGMTKPEKTLLVVTAKLLRAVLDDMAQANPGAWRSDLATINDVLRPFEAKRVGAAQK